MKENGIFIIILGMCLLCCGYLINTQKNIIQGLENENTQLLRDSECVCVEWEEKEFINCVITSPEYTVDADSFKVGVSGGLIEASGGWKTDCKHINKSVCVRSIPIEVRTEGIEKKAEGRSYCWIEDEVAGRLPLFCCRRTDDSVILQSMCFISNDAVCCEGRYPDLIDIS